jgi:hypothetical protein
MAISSRAAAARILTALHAALGRWLAHAPPPVRRKGKCSWFGCDPDTLRTALPRDPDEEEAEAWYRAHFRINGQPLP